MAIRYQILGSPGAGREALVQWLKGCQTLVCEAQYLDADIELAERHNHCTAGETGTLARDAGVGRLEVYHFSGRYDTSGQNALRAEAIQAMRAGAL